MPNFLLDKTSNTDKNKSFFEKEIEKALNIKNF